MTLSQATALQKICSGHDKYHNDTRHSHLHNAKLRGVFCYKPTRGNVAKLPGK